MCCLTQIARILRVLCLCSSGILSWYWFCYQGDGVLIEWVWECSFLCKLMNSFKKEGVNCSLNVSLGFACEVSWSWTFVGVLIPVSTGTCDWPARISHFFLLPAHVGRMLPPEQSTSSKCWRGGGRESPPNTGWECKWYNRYGGSLKKPKIELPDDPIISLLGMYLQKTWLQRSHGPRHSLQYCFNSTSKGSNLHVTDRWMKKAVVHIHNGTLLRHQKWWNHVICSNMHGPRDCHTEWSQTEGSKYCMISLIGGISFKRYNLIKKQTGL